MRNKLLDAVIKAKTKRVDSEPKRRARPAKPVVRAVPYGTFSKGANAVLDGLDRTSESKPPPPGFPRLTYFGGSDCPGESYFRGEEIESD